jgi:hypothetical protein
MAAPKRRSYVIALLVGVILATSSVALVALGIRADPEVGDPLAQVPGSEVGAASAASDVPVDSESIYDPIRAGEDPPPTYRQLLRRDQIEPVYDPTFTDSQGVDWPDDSLVIGVEGIRSAKAYPVTHLNSHEMVIDEIDGDPILVSW